jgi:hypothetical protein
VPGKPSITILKHLPKPRPNIKITLEINAVFKKDELKTPKIHNNENPKYNPEMALNTVCSSLVVIEISNNKSGLKP